MLKVPEFGKAGRSRQRVRAPRRVRTGTLLAVAASLLVLGTQAASGAPPLVPVAPPTGPITPLPGEFFRSFTDNGAFIATRASASKAKTSIEFPLSLTHAYTEVGVSQDYIKITSDLYAVSPAGVGQRYGYFPPVRVSTLAFGMLPVTATVQLSQPLLPTGYLDPLRVKLQYQNTGNNNAITHISGQIVVQLKDVEVDRVPLDVGPNCTTAQPAALKLTGLPPAYTSPIIGGPLAGTIDIGPFAHCGAGGEDLAPLLTGLLSAKGNPVKVNQGKLGVWVYPQSCPTVKVDPLSGCGIPAPPK